MKVMKRKPGQLMRLSTIHNKGEIFEFDEKLYFRIDEKTINRVRIFGTVISRFDRDEPKKFTSLTIDDGTDTIRVKIWPNQFKNQDGSIIESKDLGKDVKQGDIIDILGKVKKYENEFYVIPYNLIIRNDIEWEMNRRAQLLSIDFDRNGIISAEDEIKDLENTSNNVSDDIVVNNDLSETERLLNAFSDNYKENSIALLSERSKLDKDLVKKLMQELRVDGQVLAPEIGFYEIL